jgi:hypothetical protein
MKVREIDDVVLQFISLPCRSCKSICAKSRMT